MKFHAIGDSSPANTLLKQKGLQFAEASFRDSHQLRKPGALHKGNKAMLSEERKYGSAQTIVMA